ncbi:MAG: type II toxin-antitoxin system RelE/ParE family toxin, partial [Verrucomicrobiota bacterium]
MKVRILPSALEDLARGRDFYELQGEGLGEYFLDSLFSD